MRRRLLRLLARIFASLGQSIPPFSTAGAIITNKGKLLMIKLTYKDGYNLPGGGVSPGENLEEGLTRELKEETNLEPVSMKYIGSATADKGKYFTLVSGFEVKVKNLKSIKGSSEGEPEWLRPIDAYRKCAYKDSKEIIKNYFDL